MRRLLFVVAWVAACHPARQPDRVAGARTPRSAACDVLDGTRCLLPWPSNTFTVADAGTPTGLRVAVAAASLPIPDATTSINRSDGFSVATPLAAGFARAVDPALDGQKATSAVRLILAQPGAAGYGGAVPLRLSVIADAASPASLILAYPMLPLAYDSDYVAVVLDEVKADDGTPFVAPHPVRVALALDEPNTDDEAALLAYHAPTRAALRAAGLDAARVLRVWDFTTRSAERVAGPVAAMRAAATAAVAGGQVSVTIDSATLFTDGSGALDVRGHVDGLPAFADAGGWLAIDADGVPAAVGTAPAPFRVALPPGSGVYPVVVFGHGTGGTVNDTTFDKEIIAADAAKLNLEWAGWTDTTTLTTLYAFQSVFTGTDASTARLCQSLANEAALEALLPGALGDALAAPTLLGTPNPAAGRRPDVTRLVYAGGSLGGTLGYVLSLIDSNIHYAVLNVPGAGWTHFAPSSLLWTMASILFTGTSSQIDIALSLAMTQNNWDAVDGAAWAALSTRGDQFFLEQESIGDPVLPNIGSELVAASSHAVQVGAVIEPIAGVTPTSSATSTAITQFRVPSTVTAPLEIHGFAANDSPAGVAAREQIAAFIHSVWSGAPRVDVPASCPNGNCDFATP